MQNTQLRPVHNTVQALRRSPQERRPLLPGQGGEQAQQAEACYVRPFGRATTGQVEHEFWALPHWKHVFLSEVQTLKGLKMTS